MNWRGELEKWGSLRGWFRFVLLSALAMLALAAGTFVLFGETIMRRLDGAYNEYYVVSDLIESPTANVQPFASTQDLAEHLRAEIEREGIHSGPCFLRGLLNKPQLVAWGSYSEHMWLEDALEDLRSSE